MSVVIQALFVLVCATTSSSGHGLGAPSLAEGAAGLARGSHSASARYSRADVSKMDGRHGRPLGLVFKGMVLDVTHFLATHPGGKLALLKNAGSDATKAMLTSGMPARVFQMLEKFQIGRLNEITNDE